MLRFLSLCFVVLSVFSCSEAPTKYELSRSERKVVDSTFRVRMNTIKSEMDSLCTSERTQNKQHIKDSLIKVRLEEIENVMNQ